MRTNTFILQTRKGEAEGAIAYEYVDRTWVDKLLGRRRVNFGIGLCSPKDYNGRHVETHNVGPFTLTLKGKSFYKAGRTEEIARGRCEKGSKSGLSGTLSLKAYEWLDLAKLHNLVVEATPASWWKGIDRPVWSSCS